MSENNNSNNPAKPKPKNKKNKKNKNFKNNKNHENKQNNMLTNYYPFENKSNNYFMIITFNQVNLNPYQSIITNFLLHFLATTVLPGYKNRQSFLLIKRLTKFRLR